MLLPWMHPAHSHGLSLSSFFIFRLKRVAPQIEKRSFDLWRGSKKIVCIRGIMNLTQLRTVPTNGKYFFFPDNDYVRQVYHIRGYWIWKRKLGVSTHFSEIIALQYGKITLNGPFFWKMMRSCTRELARMQW